MQARTTTGEPTHLTIEVPKGQGTINTWRKGPSALVLQPYQVSRLRQILAEAQAVALLDRGSW